MGWNGPTAGLVHRWPMDDANVSGTTITDVVGGLDATAGTSVASITGPYTQARSTGDDVNAGMILASSPIADLSASFSIGVWLNRSTWTTTSYDGQNCTAYNCIDGGGLRFRLGNHTSVPGQLQFGNFATPSIRDLQLSISIPAGTWDHLTYTFDGATAKAYFNGVLDGASTNTSALAAGGGSGIGNGNNVFGTRPFGGSLYQLVMYNRTLSASEVLALFGAEAGICTMTPDYSFNLVKLTGY